jgi:ABC-type uncharacterized transport system substrate-binding protein
MANPVFIFNNNQLDHIHVDWTWDEMMSESILMDCDKNMDYTFSPKETSQVFADYFNNIKDYNYFSKLIINQKECSFAIENFKVKAVKNKNTVTYLFDLFPASTNQTAIKEVNLIFNDSTYYTAFDTEQKTVKIENNSRALALQSIKEYAHYGFQFIFKFKD